MGAFVEPAYGTRSLTDIVPAVAAALGARGARFETGLELPPASSYVVFLIDGLGARLLERYAHAAPYLSGLSATQQPGTAGVPSTTAASLASLGTALPPGGHGLVGFTSRVPGTDLLHNNLWWTDDLDPEEWQPNPPLISELGPHGIDVTVVNKREFADSPFTRASVRGTHFVGADRTSERIAAAVAGSGTTPSLTYLYDSDLDFTGHLAGVASSEWLQQLAQVDAAAEQLREALPSDCRLLVVADHGMVDSPADQRIDIDHHPELTDGLALLGGEARFRHLYCRRGAVDDVLATWTERVGDRAEVLSRSDAIRRGWFGPVTSGVLPRVGDVVVAATGDFTVFSSEAFAMETQLVGFHGSLTPDEMLIPVLVD